MARAPGTGGDRKAKHDMAPVIRRGYLQGLGIVARRRGMTIPELFAEWIEADPLGTLKAVSRYTVRESVKSVSGKVEHDHRHTHESLSDTAGWIEGLLGGSAEGEVAEPLPHRSVLPAAVRAAEAGH